MLDYGFALCYNVIAFTAAHFAARTIPGMVPQNSRLLVHERPAVVTSKRPRRVLPALPGDQSHWSRVTDSLRGESKTAARSVL